MRTANAAIALMFAASTALFACSEGGSDGADATARDATQPGSLCGQPGDPGNSLGVGKFCTSFDECASTSATICALIYDPTAYICTKVCDPDNPACGEGAVCTCNELGCGCSPTECVTRVFDGGFPDARPRRD